MTRRDAFRELLGLPIGVATATGLGVWGKLVRWYEECRRRRSLSARQRAWRSWYAPYAELMQYAEFMEDKFWEDIPAANTDDPLGAAYYIVRNASAGSGPAAVTQGESQPSGPPWVYSMPPFRARSPLTREPASSARAAAPPQRRIADDGALS